MNTTNTRVRADHYCIIMKHLSEMLEQVSDPFLGLETDVHLAAAIADEFRIFCDGLKATVACLHTDDYPDIYTEE